MSTTLRNQLQDAFRTDSEFNAFFADHFPEVARRLGPEMMRDQKETLVLEAIPEPLLLDKLRLAQEYSLALRAPSTYGAILGAALRLDRTTQWANIVDTRDQADPILFLLHGQRERAGLPFFVDRVCRHLAPEQGERCRIVRVPFLVDAIGAPSSSRLPSQMQSLFAIQAMDALGIDAFALSPQHRAQATIAKAQPLQRQLAQQAAQPLV